VSTTQHFNLFAVGSATRYTVFVHGALSKGSSKGRHGIVAIHEAVFGGCGFLFVPCLLFASTAAVQLSIDCNVTTVTVIKGFQADGATSGPKFTLQLLRFLSIHTRQLAPLLRVLPSLSSVSVFSPLKETNEAIQMNESEKPSFNQKHKIRLRNPHPNPNVMSGQRTAPKKKVKKAKAMTTPKRATKS